MAVEEILNFHQTNPQLGTGGQPNESQLQDIAKAGYQHVINLAMHDSDNALENEGNIVASLGMNYIHIPVPWKEPSCRHLRQFFGMMDVLEKEKVFVHCAMNLRVSAFVHQYLCLTKGNDSAQASSPILQKWQLQMDDNWRGIMNTTLDDIY